MNSVIRRTRELASITGYALASLVGCASAAVVTAATTATHETAFLAENQAAMTRMMTAMEIQPSGKIDRDFALMMIPHHQGAIDMARAELRYGHNEQLRRISQEIIVDQLQEIAAMQLALDEPLPPSIAAPTESLAIVPDDPSRAMRTPDQPTSLP